MHVTIRPLEEKDAFISWQWRNDPEVFANTGRRYSGPVTLEDELNWIRTVLARPDERRFAILADGIYIGNIYLTDIHDNQCEIGMFIGNKNYWNKGIGTKVKYLLLTKTFKHDNILKVISRVRIENFASQKVNNKIGFIEKKRRNGFITYEITPEELNDIL